MGSPRFVSPGAMAGNAIEQFLMQRQQEAMQQQEAEFRRQQAEEMAQRQAAQLALQQEQEARVAAEQQRQFERQTANDAQGVTERDRAFRADQNQVGIRQMLGDAMTQRGDPMRGLAMQAGIQLPADPPDPQAELNEYEAKRKIDAKYRPGPDTSSEPLVAVLGDDGNPVYVPRSQAIGKRPAATREQGRQVMTGDLGRIADLDTSLDDVAVLERELGSTGAGSRVGAALPNVVTEFTGLGEDSKKRQATIDRVKQVIGKALEGGVLRKEDEEKYAKILPTIGDDPQVARQKLAGLRSALQQRRTTFLESLASANFDISKYPEQHETKGAGGPAPGTRRTIRGQLAEWDGRGWLPVKK
jgi:hypothetical protein